LHNLTAVCKALDGPSLTADRGCVEDQPQRAGRVEDLAPFSSAAISAAGLRHSRGPMHSSILALRQ
jgi:hypothetical protein